MWLKLRSLLLVVVLTLSCACRGGAPELRASATYEPRWEAAPCRASYPPAIAARCGFVAVPENRARPWTADNTVRLATVVFSSPGVRHAASPTLLGGGPGGAVVALFDTLITQSDDLQRHGLPAEQYPGHRQDAEQFRQVMDLACGGAREAAASRPPHRDYSDFRYCTRSAFCCALRFSERTRS